MGRVAMSANESDEYRNLQTGDTERHARWMDDVSERVHVDLDLPQHGHRKLAARVVFCWRVSPLNNRLDGDGGEPIANRRDQGDEQPLQYTDGLREHPVFRSIPQPEPHLRLQLPSRALARKILLQVQSVLLAEFRHARLKLKDRFPSKEHIVAFHKKKFWATLSVMLFEVRTPILHCSFLCCTFLASGESTP